MSPALIGLLLSLIEQAIADAPTIIADVEKLIAAAKGQQAAPVAPIAPTIAQEDAALLAALDKPVS